MQGYSTQNASTNHNTDTTSVYRKHKQTKEQGCGQHIRKGKPGQLTTLDPSSTDSMGKEAVPS